MSSMQVAAKETQRSSVAQMKAMAEESQQLKRSLAEVESQRQGLQQALESLRGEGDKTEERIKRSEVSYDASSQQLVRKGLGSVCSAAFGRPSVQPWAPVAGELLSVTDKGKVGQ